MGDYYGTTVVEMATDSWEYSHDNNWSSGMLKHFPEVAGYDLKPKMYAYLGYGLDKGQVMADVNRTKRTIVRKNFFELITSYVNDRGLRHRPQAYGHGM